MQHLLLTKKEAAEALRIAPRTLTSWSSLGYGPAPTYIGGRCFYVQPAVDQFIEERIRAGNRAHDERAARWMQAAR